MEASGRLLRAGRKPPVTSLSQENSEFNIRYVSNVIHERINKNHNKLENQASPLIEPLLQPVNTRRLKRCWPVDLQGT